MVTAPGSQSCGGSGHPTGGSAGTPAGRRRGGYRARMSRDRDDERIESRAELLPEERTAGSDDPHDQAEQILRESDERTQDPERTGAESPQTSTPDERPGDPA